MSQTAWQLLFYGSVTIIFVVVALTAWYVSRRPLQPFALNLLAILIVIELFQAVMHLIVELTDWLPPFWQWFFNMQYELNFTATFSAVQLMLIASVAFLICFLTPNIKWWQRGYWLLVAVLFVYLSFDEFYEFHETFGSARVPTEAWRIPYAIGGAVFALISAAVWWFGYRRQFAVFALCFGGLIVMAISGIGIEEFVLQGWVTYDPSAEWMYLFEELFEMVGATIILAALLSYSQTLFSNLRWQQARRFVAVCGVLAAIWFLTALLVIPGVEARLFANEINVEYEDGLLTLVGYRVQNTEIRPGDEIMITLYWRAGEGLPEDYSLSLHLLKHNTTESVAQADELHMGPTPATAFFPGVVVRRTVYLDAPRSLPTPASYDLMLRVWYGPWPYYTPTDETIGLVVTRSEQRPLLVDDTLLVTRIVAPPDDEAPAPPTSASYAFGEGFTMTGYALPADTVDTYTLPVSFWWQTGSSPNSADLTQFFHLRHTESGDLFTFDQKPFGGTFPTTDWPPNMQAVDEWQLALQEDMPPGTYEVFTGLYNPISGERSTITENGQPVTDNSLALGTIDYAPDEAAIAAEADTSLDPFDYCYAVANDHIDLMDGLDRLIAVNRFSGEAIDRGVTGTTEVEGLTMALDGSALYTVDGVSLGQFGTLDLESGVFNPVGEGIATIPNPANSSVWGTDILNDVDGIEFEPATGILWATHFRRNAEPPLMLLYHIDTETGEVLRDAFGDGHDYIMIDISDLPGPDEYRKLEALAISPADGRFYVVAQAFDTYNSYLGYIDFDTLDIDTATVRVVPVAPLTDENGAVIQDMEGLSFAADGRLYGTTSDNSNTDDYHDSLWEIDPETGVSRHIVSFRDTLPYVDYESVACFTDTLSGAE